MSYSLSPQDFPDFVENLGSDIFEGENRFGGGAKFEKIEKNNKRIFLLHTRIEPKDKICDETQTCILQNEPKSEWGEKIIGIHENKTRNESNGMRQCPETTPTAPTQHQGYSPNAAVHPGYTKGYTLICLRVNGPIWVGARQLRVRENYS